MRRTIRIGNAGGYWGDDPGALRRQIEGGPLDYVTLDYLAEVTMSILQAHRRKRPELGYATDFLEQMRDCLPLLVEKDVTVITNAGGINPLGLGRAIGEVARGLGLEVKVGVVDGDDILADLDRLEDAGEPLANMETGESLAPVKDRVTAANVYLGAEPVVRALQAGCRVIVTGRVTDTGITLAPMIHEFGWPEDDWDRLAAGVVAGHIIECGTQATGGNFTDWRTVPNLHEVGYPIIEMGEDGVFEVTKHTGTGGLVSVATVKEQLVYEMGDPTAYISPDGVARFDTIELAQAGRNRVRVSGVKGAPRPEMFKVSMAYDDGWKATGTVLISGPEATEKAEAAARIFWKRLGHEFEATHTSVVGTGTIWPESLDRWETTEVLLRLGARDHARQKLVDFGVLLPTLILSGPSGMAVTGGRPKPSPVVAYWPALIRRSSVTARVVVLDADGDEASETITFTDPAPGPAHEPAPVVRRPRARDWPRRTRRVPLRRLAHARSGDKGDTCNIGLVARSPEIYDWLREAITPTVVRRFFKGIVEGKVTRHELHNLGALNFLMERALGGGGTVSLMLDPQGKTLSQALLEMEVEAPVRIIPTEAS
ncbi:acyclic terpene utilization AtuA family protein [bacterium]|nr:acyclic terpene utilization AtuA family protein [bacterium]